MSGVSAFLWQAALMLLVAYFLGAWFGCMLRRAFTRPPKIAMETEASRAAAAAAGGATAAAAARFGSALDGDGASQSTPAEPVTTAAAPAPRPSPPAAPAPAPSRAAEPAASAPPEPAAPDQAAPAETPPTPQPAAKFTPPMSAAEAAAAALAARRVAGRPREDSVAARMQSLDAAPTKPEVKPEARPEAKPDGSASHQDVPDLPSSAGTGGQAVVAAKIADRASYTESASAPAAASEPPSAPTDDDLTMIGGITPADAGVLRAAGVRTFADIAGWSASDVHRFNDAVGGDRRISRENWIEQAELLRLRGATGFTKGGRMSLAPRPAETEAAPVAAALPPQSAQAVASDTAAVHQAANNAAAAAAAAVATATVAANGPAPAAAAPVSKPVVSERAAFASGMRNYRQDLQQIDGINAEVEQLLYDQGVTRISQIADWSGPEQKRIDLLLGGMNRVRRENWVGQARRISGYPAETAAESASAAEIAEQAPDIAQESRAAVAAVAATLMNADGGAEIPASDGAEQDSAKASVAQIPGARNVRGLRSVRSEALVGANGIDANAVGDDLKRIRGIGVLIEKRLRAMGYTGYEQVASWTQSDIDRVNQQLDFRGRIERENWIEQARILASGGQTEFSRRRDSGEE